MIRPRYAMKLARTKLHSKRPILFASIGVSSILFAALITAIIVFTGASKSAEEFVSKANSGRYLVSVSPVVPPSVYSFGSGLSTKDVHEIEAAQTTYYNHVRDTYTSLGINYNSSGEIPALVPASYKPLSVPSELRVDVNYQSPVVKQLLTDRYNNYIATAKNTVSDLKVIAAKYRGSDLYTMGASGLPAIPGTRLIQNDKEDFGDTDLKAGDNTDYGYFTNAIHNGFYTIYDQSLISRYLTTTSTTNLKGIPVIVSAQEAAMLFGSSMNIGKQPSDTTSNVSWLKSVQGKLTGTTYQVCFRNSTEQAMLTKIQADYVEEVDNSANKEYQAPHLQYAYPTNPCGNITVKQDTRTDAEIKEQNDRDRVDAKLGTYTPPQHRLLTFQIVGIINAQPYIQYDKSFNDYIKNLITVNNLTSSAIIPLQMYNSLPASMKFDDLVPESQKENQDYGSRIVSFPTIADAQAFMTSEACPTSNSSCTKLFTADPYGSNYLILDQIGKLFAQIASMAFPIILGLALIIIWFTISRITAENRQETAIYRAMGASRADIFAVYLTYTLLVAMRITAISLALGIAAAYAVQYIYGRHLSDVALASFGTIKGGHSFYLFDLSSPLLIIIILVILGVSVLASVPSLIANVIRPPVKDLKSQ